MKDFRDDVIDVECKIGDILDDLVLNHQNDLMNLYSIRSMYLRIADKLIRDTDYITALIVKAKANQ